MSAKIKFTNQLTKKQIESAKKHLANGGLFHCGRASTLTKKEIDLPWVSEAEIINQPKEKK